jgi:hypothetical protein
MEPVLLPLIFAALQSIIRIIVPAFQPARLHLLLQGFCRLARARDLGVPFDLEAGPLAGGELIQVPDLTATCGGVTGGGEPRSGPPTAEN